MWSSDRRTVIRAAALATAALGVAACGFEPMYGTGTTARAGLGQIYVEPIDSAAGYELRDWLIMELGPASQPTHRLEIDLEIETDGVALTTTNVTTRFNVTGEADFRLVSLTSNETALSGNVEGISGYSAPESETASAYATRVARADAIRRVSRQLAERIALRLSIESSKWAETTPGIAEDGSGA
ncbi:LPS assembly lipoprotein LptE [Amaricoccus macauensis]|uniref:LPS assembly lipoprotein LptE n=1 Tax=Amaricoccus macauensis TaxID=57001 RepID=UPI003C7AC1A1